MSLIPWSFLYTSVIHAAENAARNSGGPCQTIIRLLWCPDLIPPESFCCCCLQNVSHGELACSWERAEQAGSRVKAKARILQPGK